MIRRRRWKRQRNRLLPLAGGWIAVTCDYAKGSSGAPVLDATGAVVGIVKVTSPVYYETKDGIPSKLQMVWKYCIPSSALLELTSGKDGL